MRVVLVNPIGKIGGAERMLLAVLQSLADRFADLRATVVTLSDGPLLEAAREAGAEALCVPASDALNSLGESRHPMAAAARAAAAAPRAWLLARRLRRRIESLQPDVVHSFGLKTHLLLALQPPRRARIVWQVQDYYSRRTLSRLLCERASRRVDRLIGVSGSVARDAQTMVAPQKVVAIDNAVNTARFTPEGDAIDLAAAAGRAGASAGSVKVGLVAAYARWKGHPTFLEAAKRALEAGATDAAFFIVGGPIYSTAGQFSQDELEAIAHRLGIADRVFFVPFQADTASVYRALDVVVHASTDPEPFGLVICEAMACGRAAVVANAGGAAGLFTDGVDALGHPPGDADRLATQVCRLVEDASLRRRLGERGLETVRRLYHLGRYADDIESLYRRLLAGAA